MSQLGTFQAVDDHNVSFPHSCTLLPFVHDTEQIYHEGAKQATKRTAAGMRNAETREKPSTIIVHHRREVHPLNNTRSDSLARACRQ